MRRTLTLALLPAVVAWLCTCAADPAGPGDGTGSSPRDTADTPPPDTSTTPPEDTTDTTTTPPPDDGYIAAVCTASACASAVEPESDSVAIRAILDTNGLSDVTVEEVATFTGDNAATLTLIGRSITILPPALGSLTGLGDLRLDSNALTALPAEIGCLRNVVMLSVGYNHLTGLPESIGDMSSLRTLVLHGNRIESLPSRIGCLTDVYGVYLAGNQISSLPPQIGGMSGMRILDLSHNHLTSVPPALGRCASLETLRLGNNLLTSLPAQLTALPVKEYQLRCYTGIMGRWCDTIPCLQLDSNALCDLPPTVSHWADSLAGEWQGSQRCP